MDSQSDSRPRTSTEPPAVHEFVTGETIGRYVLIDQVGQGGMGVVFAAFDPQLNRKVALKILRASQADADERHQLRARLYREAQAIAKLSHPNVITVYDVGTVGASVFVAMEFVEGVTLTEYLQKARGLDAVLDAFAQAGRGLSAAHQAGLVHRDFKPDNVLMGLDGVARVSDFGLARSDPSLVVDEDDDGEFMASAPQQREFDETNLLSSPMTQAGAVVGTPRYMAPEQHAGAPPDPRSDQFAFCVALYQALYGQEPFVAHTMERLVYAKQHGRIVEPPTSKKLPGRLEQLVWRGLSPDPRRRYPSMGALLEDLRNDPAVRGRPVLRWVVGVGLSSAALGIAALQSGETRESDECRDGRERWAQVWSKERRAAVQLAFESADMDGSRVSWPAIARALDAYGTTFLEQHAEACGTVQGRPSQGDMLFQLRHACLMERADYADALIALFEQPDGALVRAAPQAVAELPGLMRCSEVAGLLARGGAREVTTPADASVLRRGLMQSRVFVLAHRYGDARERAEDALRSADQLGFDDLSVEARTALGRALAGAGRYADAEIQLREAVLGGTRAAHDEAAAEAAIALVEVLGVHLDRHGEAVQWEARADALLDRIDEQGILRARLQNRAGRLDARRGDYVEARTHHTQALALREKVRGRDDPGRAAWMIDLGDVALAQRDFDLAVDIFDRALVLAEATLSAAHPTRAAALEGLGRVHLGREEFGSARQAFLDAKAGLEQSLGAEHPRTARVWLGLATADAALGNIVAADAGFSRAGDLLSTTLGRGHALHRRALLGRERCARESDRLGDAEGWWERACGGPVVPGSLEGECTAERAELDLRVGHADDAAAGFARAASIYADGSSADASKRAAALLGLAKASLEQGNIEGARRAVADAEASVRKVRGYVPRVRSDVDRAAARLLRTTAG